MPLPASLPLLHLALQVILVGGISLLLFRLRHRYGLGLLYIFVGSMQFYAGVLVSTVYLEVGGLTLSPGSTVLFTASLFAVLLIYLRADIPQTRTLIYGVVVANATLTLLSWLTSLSVSHVAPGLGGAGSEIFAVPTRIFLVGTITLLVDSFLIILVFEFLSFKAPRLPLAARLIGALLGTLWFDSLVFTTGSFFGDPGFPDILAGQLLGKSFAGLLFALLLLLYLRVLEPAARGRDLTVTTDMLDVFSILTYRERYELVREQLKAAEASNLAKTRFLAHMSHELRTPLTSILGFADLLIKGGDSADDGRRGPYLRRIHRSANHLLQLINGLLDLSRIESGKVDLTYSRFSLGELIDRIRDDLNGQAEAKQLELRVESPPFDVQVNSDRLRLRQIITNLVGNAIKFTPAGTVVIRLAAHPATREPLRLEVTDSGIGIPQEKLEVIFEAFEQVESGDDRAYPGTGLGLAIARALCDQLGYALEVSSEVDVGSVFTIVFNPPSASELIRAGTRRTRTAAA